VEIKYLSKWLKMASCLYIYTFYVLGSHCQNLLAILQEPQPIPSEISENGLDPETPELKSERNLKPLNH